MRWIRLDFPEPVAPRIATSSPGSATRSIWLSTGSLLVRINFAQTVAHGKIPGVTFDLLEMIGRHEPTSVGEAVELYAPLILPARPLGKLLTEVPAGEPPPAAEPPKNARQQQQAEVAARRRALRSAQQAIAVLLASPEFQYR